MSWYVSGLDDTRTPSVLDPNGMAAMLAASHVQRMAFGEDAKGKEFAYYDRQQCQIITAALPPPNEDCPMCGTYGVLGRGDLPPSESQAGAGNKPVLRMAAGEESDAAEDPAENMQRPEVEILEEAKP